MCQAKKDGGNRCAFHYKVEIANLEKKRDDLVKGKIDDFIKDNPDVINDPFVRAQYEDKLLQIREEIENHNTIDDVLEAHRTAMASKQLRDEEAQKAQESGSHYDIAASAKSFAKLFRQGKSDSALSPQDVVRKLGNAGAIGDNPDAAIKAFYFDKAALEEYRQVTVRQRENPTPEGLEKLRQVAEIRKKAEAEVEKYGLKNLVNGANPHLEKVLDDRNPGISVYQYNYEHDVQRFKEKRKRYETAEPSESKMEEEYERRALPIKMDAVKKFGRSSRAVLDFETKVLSKDQDLQKMNAKISAVKDEYSLSPTYRKTLAAQVNVLKSKARYSEAASMEAKLEALTNLYNERQARNKEINEQVKART